MIALSIALCFSSSSSCRSCRHGVLEDQRADTPKEALGPTGIQLARGRRLGLLLDTHAEGTQETLKAILGGLFGAHLAQAMAVVVENGTGVKGDQSQVFVPVESVDEIPKPQRQFELSDVALGHGSKVIGESEIVGDDELILLIRARLIMSIG